MSIQAKLRTIERKIKAMKLDSRVHFFINEKEYQEAFKKGRIGENDVCFIDDVPEKE